MEEVKPLEEQYILRFVGAELGQRIRKLIQNDEIDGKISFHFPEKSRIGQMTIIGTEGKPEKFKVTLCDLPCVVETHKTEDNRIYYKSGDIGQILLVDEEKVTEVKEGEMEPEIQKQQEKQLYDNNYNIMIGLTPATKNIRKRKFRKKTKYSAADMKEAQAEIIRLQKGGSDYELDYISVNDVDAIYETPLGNTIVTFKNGKPPIRAGDPSTFTDAEIDLLPEPHRKLAKEFLLGEPIQQQENKLKVKEGEGENKAQDETQLQGNDVLGSDEISFSSDDEPSDFDNNGAETQQQAKKMRIEITNGDEEINSNLVVNINNKIKNEIQSETAPTTTTSSVDPNDPQIAQIIRTLRCKKVDIAIEVNKLSEKIEGLKNQANVERNQVIKTRLLTSIDKMKESINLKKQEMTGVDSELAKYNVL